MFGLSLAQLTKLNFPELLLGKHADIDDALSAASLHHKVVQIQPNIRTKSSVSNQGHGLELFANDIIHQNEACICVVLKEYTTSQPTLSEFIQTNVLYQNLMSITPDAAFIIDLTGKIICSSAYGQNTFRLCTSR